MIGIDGICINHGLALHFVGDDFPLLDQFVGLGSAKAAPLPATLPLRSKRRSRCHLDSLAGSPGVAVARAMRVGVVRVLGVGLRDQLAPPRSIALVPGGNVTIDQFMNVAHSVTP